MLQPITKDTSMRTLIYTAFVSLDGVVEAPGGEPGYRNSGWTMKDIEFSADAYEIKGREQTEASAMMMGRVSYEAFAPVWPDMEDFAEYKVMPKYVVSTTLGEGELVSNWGEITILRSLDDVAAVKRTDGGPIIIHGSATLSRNLSDAGLIDRYHLLGVPGAARCRQADVQRHRQGQADVDAGRERVLPQRHPEARLRRRRLTTARPFERGRGQRFESEASTDQLIRHPTHSRLEGRPSDGVRRRLRGHARHCRTGDVVDRRSRGLRRRFTPQG